MLQIITQSDIDLLSETDQVLLYEYISEQIAIAKLEKEILNGEEHDKATLKKYIESRISGSIDVYKKSRTGQKVFGEILTNKTVFEYCCIYFPDITALIDDTIALEKESFVVKFKNNMLSNLYTVKELKKKELELIETENKTKNSQLFCEIADLKLTDLSLNVEKYEIRLSNTINPIKLEFGVNLNKNKELIKDYDENKSLESLVGILQSGIIESSMNKTLDILRNYGYSIIENKKRYSLSKFIIDFDQTEYQNGEEFTLNRQVHAINYLLNELGANQLDNTVKAKFIQFLTKRNLGAKKINDSEVYKKLNKLDLSESDKIFLENQFNALGFDEIIKKIRKS